MRLSQMSGVVILVICSCTLVVFSSMAVEGAGTGLPTALQQFAGPARSSHSSSHC
jgi:hypothetical protein